jgi:uracil-DNA glycosylase family protein
MPSTASPPKSAEPFVPHGASITKLRTASRDCRGCPLYANATQTVFGEGPARARIVLVGEQPGDVEDRQGHPFVGPAGRLLDELLVLAGLDREHVYLTNVVKHFFWEPRGKRRIHKRPHEKMIDACRPWLLEELARIRPAVLVCLGATATKAVLGAGVLVSQSAGRVLGSPLCARTIATLHPSAILRARDDGRELQRARLIADLRLAGQTALRP